MPRANHDLSERQHGLLKAIHLLNGKRRVLRYGSMENVRLPYHTLIHHYLLPPDLPFVAGCGKSVLWYYRFLKCFQVPGLTR
jgi:hypothetical protein